jgi:tRNA-specific 2-thiouridylase
LTGLDADKDQSYFLYGLRQDQLAHTMFPLGALTKPQVRDVARRHGLVTAEKPESQEICFVPGGDYRAALRDRAGWTETPGNLVDSDGRTVGEHRGAAAYTIGQRTGLGVALGEPRYVSSIDAQANVITLGRREDLYRDEFSMERVSFVAGEPPRDEFATHVRIRHRATPVPGTVSRRGERWNVRLDAPTWAPAPGQAAVFYDGEEVVGGGRIANA